MKQFVSSLLLRWMLPWFDSSESRFDQLLGKAVRLQLGRLSDEEFRQNMAQFYAESTPQGLAEEVRFDELRGALDRPGGHKVSIVQLSRDSRRPGVGARWNLWRRRFSLLARLHIRTDLLILRCGERIPPHGHSRVVSGFCLIAGRVACRHYDRVREGDGCVYVRQALDLVHEPGGYTTNSEFHHNIHWLQGIAPVSYLFRITVTNTPTSTFGTFKTTNERIYIDPTGPADADGVIRGMYVSQDAAKELQISARQEQAACES